MRVVSHQGGLTGQQVGPKPADTHWVTNCEDEGTGTAFALGHGFSINQRYTYIDDRPGKYQLQTKEASYIHLNTGIRLESSCTGK